MGFMPHFWFRTITKRILLYHLY